MGECSMRSKLLQLQELENAYEAADSKNLKTRISGQIKTLKGQIPDNYITRFYRLYSRYGSAIVRANGGICHGCYLNLPSSQASEVTHSKVLHTCQNCGRFLYVDSQEKLAIF